MQLKKNKVFIVIANCPGKSLITYLLVRFNLLRLDKKILIIVATTSLQNNCLKILKIMPVA